MTICEALSWVTTCGSAFDQKNKMVLDTYVFKEIVVEEEEVNSN